MISSWKCFFIIVLKILLVTADQTYETSPRLPSQVNPKDVCNLPPDKGTCSRRYRRWYYNSSNNICDKFVYSGCGGNDNRFAFFKDCSNMCVKEADVTTRNDLPPTSDPTNYTIHLKPGGEGKASPDWKNLSWDKNTDVTAVDDVSPTSVRKDYTRRFNPDMEVETTTDSRTNTNADVTTRNDLPPTSDPTNYTIHLKPGREGKASPDWKKSSWDEHTGVTAVDDFSPTSVKKGYTRRFNPDREVETTTDSRRNTNAGICSQPQEPGHCFRNYLLLRWYYDSSNNTCKIFFYSGCGGNDNCFDDFQGCARVCFKKTAKDICNQPKDPGYCWGGRNYHIRWYYDNSTNSCKWFYYYGCGKNDNRFYRLQACRQQCVTDETTTDFMYPTDDQMRTSDFIYPGIRTKDWISSPRTVDWEEENRVVIDVPTSYKGREGIMNYVGYTVAIVFVFVVLTFIRMATAKYLCAEQNEQLLSSNAEAGRTSSSDDNSSPLRVSICVISLSNAKQQSSDESTAGYEMPKSDQNSSETQPFLDAMAPPAYYPPHPPQYQP